jgi:hypothetical protein
MNLPGELQDRPWRPFVSGEGGIKGRAHHCLLFRQPLNL